MAQDLAINAAPKSFPLGATDARSGDGQGQTSAQASKMKELAQQFEGMLLLQMIREMRQSLGSDGEGEGGGLMSGTGTMADTMSSAFAMQLSQFGGFGLSNALMGSFTRQAASESTPATGLTMGTAAALAAAGAVPGMASVLPAALAGAVLPLTSGALAGAPGNAESLDPRLRGGDGSPVDQPRHSRERGNPENASRLRGDEQPVTGTPQAAAAVLPDLDDVLDAPVNSPFGWRTDPIDGRSRFHNGVDLRAAYGDEVPVVGAGTVTFAGEQGGYGLTVVVRHADGIETRYAHLSSIAVNQGDQVQAGQVIGRVGQSGRATGPHLHFEVTDHGERLDPEALEERFGYGAHGAPASGTERAVARASEASRGSGQSPD